MDTGHTHYDLWNMAYKECLKYLLSSSCDMEILVTNTSSPQQLTFEEQTQSHQTD